MQAEVTRRLIMNKIEILEDKALEIVYSIPTYFILIKAPHPRVTGIIYFEIDPEAIEVVKKAYEKWERKKWKENQKHNDKTGD
jgi:hypothetical protein